MSMRKVPQILALSALCAILSGCHRGGFSFHKKLYFFGEPTAIQMPFGSVHRPTMPTPAFPPQQPSQSHTQTLPTITIWIHGAQPFKPNSYNLGLKPAKAFREDDQLGQIAATLNKSDPIRFPFDNIYFFSWSGMLSFKERKSYSRILYEQLSALVKSYEQTYGTRPNIRIIAHSHGGNVALNLAKIKDIPLVIDELILLACPVQDKTAALTQSKIFKKIYSLYSTLDVVQVIDPQGLYPCRFIKSIFSRQRFAPQENLLQVKVRINGHSFLHHEFHDTPFLTILSPLIDQLDAWHTASPIKAHLAHHSRFVLSIYTNGRRPPRHQNYRNSQHEHVALQIPGSPE
jgi:hypothetical protein